MDVIPGIQASSLKDPSMEVQEQIAEESIDILLHWHSVENPQGYGLLDGPFYKRWTDYLKPELLKVYADVKDNVPEGAMPPIIPEMADRSLEEIEDILTAARVASSVLPRRFSAAISFSRFSAMVSKLGLDDFLRSA